MNRTILIAAILAATRLAHGQEPSQTAATGPDIPEGARVTVEILSCGWMEVGVVESADDLASLRTLLRGLPATQGAPPEDCFVGEFRLSLPGADGTGPSYIVRGDGVYAFGAEDRRCIAAYGGGLAVTAWLREWERRDTAAAAAPATVSIEVTWSVTSGMPPPRWIVSAPADVGEILARLRDLPAIEAGDWESSFPGGFFLEISDPAAASLPARLYFVQEGRIVPYVEDGPGRDHRTDARGLEAWLLANKERWEEAPWK